MRGPTKPLPKKKAQKAAHGRASNGLRRLRNQRWAHVASAVGQRAEVEQGAAAARHLLRQLAQLRAVRLGGGAEDVLRGVPCVEHARARVAREHKITMRNVAAVGDVKHDPAHAHRKFKLSMACASWMRQEVGAETEAERGASFTLHSAAPTVTIVRHSKASSARQAQKPHRHLSLPGVAPAAQSLLWALLHRTGEAHAAPGSPLSGGRGEEAGGRVP